VRLPLAGRLATLVAQRGWQPGRADLGELEVLLGGEAELAELAERALARLPPPAAWTFVEGRFAASTPPLRGRLVRLAGRLAADGEERAGRRFLESALCDDDDKSRRNAAIALGKLPYAESSERLLLALWPEAGLELRRALVEALGKAGGPEARTLLDGLGAIDDDRLRALVSEARLRLGRTLGRTVERGGLRAEVALGPGWQVVARSRHGLAGWVREELAALPRLREVEVLDPEAVQASYEGPLAALFGCRTALGFELPCRLPAHVAGGGDHAGEGPGSTCTDASRGAPGSRVRAGSGSTKHDASAATTRSAPRSRVRLAPEDRAAAFDPERLGQLVVEVLTSSEVRALLGRLTVGPVRWRLEWADAGHRRSLTYRIAAEVAARAPELVNDPTDSLWELVVREQPRLGLSLRPRGLEDPRFAWRTAMRPASSHPTVAAALALAARVRPSDVVWDPFVGTGAELVECGLRAAGVRLLGSDLEPAALEGARQNLTAAGLTATLLAADATHDLPPARPTLIITNPPMGRRVLDRQGTRALLPAFLQHVGRVLAPGGRLAWIAPRGDECVAEAARVGLVPRLRQRVDMGGFWGELQLLERRRG
jgi:hypothetical protein